jgi:methionine biosynthesis protein MetW
MIFTKRRYERYWKEKQAKESVDSNEKLFPSEILGAIELLLKGRGRLLDVGCGNGNVMEIAKHKFDEAHGCDISETVLESAKNKGILTTCIDLNTSYLSYQNECFDTVTCLEVLEHMFNPIKLLREIYRVLSLEGQLILTTPNIRYFKNINKLLLRGKFPHTTTDTFVWGGGHLHYFTRKDLAFLLREAGFEKMRFHINEEQFQRSKKRRFAREIIGSSAFGEWLCGGIIVEAIKE